MHRQNRACKKTKGGLKRKLNTFFGWISGILTLFLMVIAGAPEPDDIILFRATGFGMDTYVTHRLIGKDEGGYITKGDHNEHADPGRVQEADILGTVEYILF